MGSETLVETRYLLDTPLLIDHFNGVTEATAWVLAHRRESVLSVVTRAEVLVGVSQDDKPTVSRFLDRFRCLSVTTSVADRAAELRRQHRWKLPDAFQAALAVENGLRLVTRNTKDFAEDKHSFVLVPYAL